MSCPYPSATTSETSLDSFLIIKILLFRCQLFIEHGYYEDSQSDLLWAKQLLFSDQSGKPFGAFSSEHSSSPPNPDSADLEQHIQSLNLSSETSDSSINSNETWRENEKVIKEYFRRKLLHLHLMVQHLQRPQRDDQKTAPKPLDWTCLQQIGPMNNKCYEQKLEMDRLRLSKLMQNKEQDIRRIRLQRASLIEPKVECFDENDLLPGARTGIKMHVTAPKGRHLKAERTFETGQILFAENAIVSWLRPSMYLHYCNACLKRVKGHFVTCANCPDVIYCGVKCRNSAWTAYHQYECARLYFLRYLAYGHMALRLLAMYSYNELMRQRKVVRERFERTHHLKVMPFDQETYSSNEINNNELSGDSLRSKSRSCDSVIIDHDLKSIGFDSVVNEPSMNESLKDKQRWAEQGFRSPDGDMSVFYSLVSADRHFSADNLLAISIMAKILGKLAVEMNLVPAFDSKKQFNELSAALYDCVLKVNFNCYLINDHKIVPSTESHHLWAKATTARKIGIGVYGSASMISHSCDFNSVKLAIGSQLIIHNVKRLLPGDEITVTYGPHYQKDTIYDRRKLLKECYMFHCECEACANGWENLSLAYRCTHCDRGALIWFAEGGGYCTNCNFKYPEDSTELYHLYVLSEEAQSWLQKAQEALNNNDLRVCRKHLRETFRLCKKVFYSHQRMYPLYALYSDYYEARRKYVKARKMVEKMGEIQAAKFGAGTVEWLSTCVKKAVLMVREIQLKRGKSTKLKLLKKLESHLQGCEQTYEDLCKQEMVCGARYHFEQIPRLKSIRLFLENEFKDL